MYDSDIKAKAQQMVVDVKNFILNMSDSESTDNIFDSEAGVVRSQRGAGYLYGIQAFHNAINELKKYNDAGSIDDMMWLGDYPAVFMKGYQYHIHYGTQTTQMGTAYDVEYAEHILRQFLGGQNLTSDYVDVLYYLTDSQGGRKIVNMQGQEEIFRCGHLNEWTSNTNPSSYPPVNFVAIPVSNRTNADITYGSGNAFRLATHTYGSNTNYSQAVGWCYTPVGATDSDRYQTTGYQATCILSSGATSTSNAITEFSLDTGETYTNPLVLPAKSTSILIFRTAAVYTYNQNSHQMFKDTTIIRNIDAIIDGTNVVVDYGMLGSLLSFQRVAPRGTYLTNQEVGAPEDIWKYTKPKWR